MTFGNGNSSLESLIATIRNHACDFYRNRWGDASIESLPLTSRTDLRETPHSRRRYKEGKSLLKIVRDHGGSFLSEWNLDDIKNEQFGIPSQRPMVYFRNQHETMEKALWCYTNGMVRLTGEANADLSVYTAERFQVDSLLCDAHSLSCMMPFFERITQPLESLSIIASSFDTKTLAPYQKFALRMRLVLSLPECGAFAEAPLTETLEFSPHADCAIEYEDGRLVLSKNTLLVTPIIRYDTGLRASPTSGNRFVLSSASA
ncbi:MAG: hypothetical protein WA021_03840 [Minisyncoccia bacterium]